MPPDMDDPFTAVEGLLFQSVLLMIRMRLRAAAEDRLRGLEAAAGRELPEVRGQLAALFGDDPDRSALAEPTPQTALTAVKRGRGRPPKPSPDPSSPGDATVP